MRETANFHIILAVVFAEIPSANHALACHGEFGFHYIEAIIHSSDDSLRLADRAFLKLGNRCGANSQTKIRDQKRRRILIPMIRAEMKRREKIRESLPLEPITIPVEF